jgi:hypothetical protein
LLPGFWDEPLNAVSHIAFWLAAWLVWRRWQCWQRWQRWQRSVFTNVQPEAVSGSADIKSLLVMLLLIGAASFAFHTLATRWAGGLDMLFIAVYLHFYLAVYMHRAMGLRWRVAWLGIPLIFCGQLELAPTRHAAVQRLAVGNPFRLACVERGDPWVYQLGSGSASSGRAYC